MFFLPNSRRTLDSSAFLFFVRHNAAARTYIILSCNVYEHKRGARVIYKINDHGNNLELKNVSENERRVENK